MNKSIILIVIFLLVWTMSAHAENSVCSEDKNLINACYNVHGKIIMHANLRPYLHLSENDRWLGIVQRSDDINAGYYWPSDIEKVFDYDTDVWGDFRVCPFTPDEPGKMRFVCIDSVANLKPQPSAVHYNK